MSDYIPKGQALKFILAAREQPNRLWTPADVGHVLGQTTKKLGATLLYSLRAGLIFKAKVGRSVFYKATPFTDSVNVVPDLPARARQKTVAERPWDSSQEDVRFQKVIPGWVPPKMVCVRLQA